MKNTGDANQVYLVTADYVEMEEFVVFDDPVRAEQFDTYMRTQAQHKFGPRTDGEGFALLVRYVNADDKISDEALYAEVSARWNSRSSYWVETLDAHTQHEDD